MLVELSKSQDIEAGDGTTSVCVIAGSLLDACHQLLVKGLHPTSIAEAFMLAANTCDSILQACAKPVKLSERDRLVDAVTTCLSSKVISQNSETLAPLAVDAVLSVLDTSFATTVDLNAIKIVKQVGGTVDDTELVNGIVFAQGAKKAAGGPTRVENAKIGLIQFCLSAPKTDMENNVVVSDYAAMDRLLREERKHVLGLCKKIKKCGITVLLIQKSILRDAYNDLSLHFLSKLLPCLSMLRLLDPTPRAGWVSWLLQTLSEDLYRTLPKPSTCCPLHTSIHSIRASSGQLRLYMRFLCLVPRRRLSKLQVYRKRVPL
mmetsp:Transcript_13227/g.40767  ORF Transcript_13227/g.40767 Transcript_13227/m.40767 type:complete len:318 (-) Transcript_13227:603-1556(-)